MNIVTGVSDVWHNLYSQYLLYNDFLTVYSWIQLQCHCKLKHKFSIFMYLHKYTSCNKISISMNNHVLKILLCITYVLTYLCNIFSKSTIGQSVQLSMQMYGCRVVQKALEYVSTQRLIALVSEFENSQVLLRCVHDANGMNNFPL